MTENGCKACDGAPLLGRVSMAAVTRTLGSRTAPLDPRGAGVLRSVAAAAVWTKTCLADAGYEVDCRCALCRAAPDTLRHRWWECSASQSERERLTTPRQRERAKVAGPASVLYERAIMEHPAESWYGPCPETQAVVEFRNHGNEAWRTHVASDSVELMRGQGDLFTDGSCTTHPIAECCRAAWAVVCVLPCGTAVARVSGAVPADCPQTAQAAEYRAAGAAAEHADASTRIRSDCLNVVRHFNDHGSSQLSRKKRYAGVVRTARAFSDFHAAQRMLKVPAHVAVESCETLFDRFCALGSDAADAAAKEALSRHRAQEETVLRKWEFEWEDAVATARLIAAVGSLWPAARPPGGRRLPGPQRLEVYRRRRSEQASARARRQQERLEGQATHAWTSWRGVRRCRRCGVPWAASGAAAAACTGTRFFFGRCVRQSPRPPVNGSSREPS